MLEQSPTHSGKIRFGVFETDLRSGELRKCGIRIKLQSQPFKLLAILLSHRRRNCHEGGTAAADLGFRNGGQLRPQPGHGGKQSPRGARRFGRESPVYRDIGKRGYRFIAPVQLLDSVDPPPISKTILSPRTGLVFAKRNRPLARRAVGESRGEQSVSCFSDWSSSPCSSALWGLGGPAKPTLLRFAQITSSESIFPGDIGVERFPVLLTDGSRLYFSKIEGGRVALAYSAISGGDAHPLVTPPEIGAPRLADISPDGSKLLVFSETLTELERTMWIVPSAGGAARKIASGLGHDGMWLPDGNTVLYASGRNIMIDSRRRSGSACADVCPRTGVLAPFLRPTARACGSPYRIRRPALRRFGSSRSQTKSCGRCCRGGPIRHPNVAATGPRTGSTSYSSRTGRTEAISGCCPRRAGSARRRRALPTDCWSAELSSGPVPARQGTQIFFIGAHKRSQLRRYDAASRQFIPYLRDISMAGRTAVSRDGTRVAWISTSDGAMWQSGLDGSRRLQLTSRPMRVFMMRWSPDGSSIAFMGKEPGKVWKVYTISTEGGKPQVVSDEARSQADPDWSPDGRTIVFGRSSEYMAEDATPKSIQMVDVASRRVSVVPGSEGLFSPRWSPDGRFLVAMPLDQRKLMLFDLASKRWTEIASGSFNNPVWSNDGTHIYYQSYDEGSPIRRMDVATGRVEEVADFRDLQPGATVGYWGITSEDAPIVSFHFLTADVYSVDWTRR